jgi:hypothetical protein
MKSERSMSVSCSPFSPDTAALGIIIYLYPLAFRDMEASGTYRIRHSDFLKLM